MIRFLGDDSKQSRGEEQVGVQIKQGVINLQSGPNGQIWDNVGNKITIGMDCDSWNKTNILKYVLE